MNWYLKVLQNYVGFEGRARRKEYWFFILFNVIFLLILATIDQALGLLDPEVGIGPLSGLYSLAVLIPSIAVGVRRLHDTERSGWWLLIALVPLVGGIILLIFMVLDSTPGSNRFGANPKEETLVS